MSSDSLFTMLMTKKPGNFAEQVSKKECISFYKERFDAFDFSFALALKHLHSTGNNSRNRFATEAYIFDHSTVSVEFHADVLTISSCIARSY